MLRIFPSSFLALKFNLTLSLLLTLPLTLPLTLSLTLLSATLPQTAMAQEREFHAKAIAATMTTAIYPNVLINGKVRFLAANAQIRNVDNMIVTPNSIIDGSYPVRYLENDSGEIFRVWILTADEAATARDSLRAHIPTVR